MSYMEKVDVQFTDGPTIDAFARLRVSNPIAIFDNTFQYNLNPNKFSNSLTGAATITHVPAGACARLSTGGTTLGDKAILQTKEYVRYQPGKSQMILITGNIGAPVANVRQRIGYFDDANGLFFEQTNTAMSVVVRSSVSGSPVDTAVAQAAWNLDTLDGNGPSLITLDPTKSQIFFIDFEWLGVGRIRFGFVIDGIPVYCHEVLNANNITTVYMTTPNLPIRAEIENTGTAAGATTMDQFCMSVISEGGAEVPFRRQFSYGMGATPLAVTTRVPVLSIRLAPTFNSLVNRGKLILAALEVMASTNNCYWELVYNGALTGAAFASVNANSLAEYDITATAISGGIVIDQGWALSTGVPTRNTLKTQNSISEILLNDFAGTGPDTITLVATSLAATSNVQGIFKWLEER